MKMFRRTAIIILSVYLSILVTAVAQTTSLECSDIGCAFSSSQSPQCWGQYNLSTNYYEEWPNTSVVREYFFDLVNTTAAPDGVERMVLTINGSIPGPTIFADWGDTVGMLIADAVKDDHFPRSTFRIVLMILILVIEVVHVRNSLENNGTGIHFHGIRQLNTTDQDGVPSITQCPTAPGDTFTYTWRALQYGTSWYHSHYELQAWNGVFGGIIINGPASAPYDEDLGTITLNDWYHETPESLYSFVLANGPPNATSGLINGTGVYMNSTGIRFEAIFEPGKRYRLRIINAALSAGWKFMIDNHYLTVIATDFVPIVPYNTTSVNIAMGQRYDLVIAADQRADRDYWIRSIPLSWCSAYETFEAITGILRYDGSTTTGNPATQAWPYNGTSCRDEPSSSLVPYLSMNVGAEEIRDQFNFSLVQPGGAYQWAVNKSIFSTDWSYPTVQQVLDGNNTYGATQQIITLPEADQWVYFVITAPDDIDHPMHLHGHDFWILAKGVGAFDASVRLNTNNPPRRDTAMLPASGYLVIAFLTDNPGIWLFHCHIGWHASQGLALQLVERVHEISAGVDDVRLSETCSKWHEYTNASGLTVQQYEAVV